MKKFWLIFLAVALLVSLVCHAALALRRSADQMRLVSTVKAPLRWAVAEIERDLVEGRKERALKKIAELRLESDQFFHENGIHHGLGDIIGRFREIENDTTSN